MVAGRQIIAKLYRRHCDPPQRAVANQRRACNGDWRQREYLIGATERGGGRAADPAGRRTAINHDRDLGFLAGMGGGGIKGIVQSYGNAAPRSDCHIQTFARRNQVQAALHGQRLGEKSRPDGAVTSG